MRTIGMIATGFVGAIGLGVVAVALLSIPDIRRYLGMRRM